jgi:uncharacterized membrane protein
MIEKNRIQSIDFLKGLVMVIMALDHVRDFFHRDAFIYDPFDIDQTSIPVFFTGWITHFCAPTFSLLAGISVYLMSLRKTPKELSAFLIKRGLWLVFLDVTFVTFAWFFDVHFGLLLLTVIWTLGVSMIVLAALIHLPRVFILIFSCVIIFGHNLLPFEGDLLIKIFHGFALIKISDNTTLFVAWSLLPWIGVMPLGYWLGYLFDPSFDSLKRKKILIATGVGGVLLFIFLRYINIYGDPMPWKAFDSTSKTIMSFLNTLKYPASLLFLLMTLGPTLILLAYSEKVKGRLAAFFITFGRVPFFYYFIHLYLIHFLVILFYGLSGFGWGKMISSDWLFKAETFKGFGYSLLIVYLVWIGVILLTYPLCVKFEKYKTENKQKWWLSYL